jgi:hypothetical protein
MKRMHATAGLSVLFALAACTSAVARDGFLLESYPPQLGGAIAKGEAALRVDAAAIVGESRSAASTVVRPFPGQRLELGMDRHRLELEAGRWAVTVALPANRMVTVAVAGTSGTLRAFEVIGQRALRKLRTAESDGRLPQLVSFRTADDPEPLTVVVDSEAPVSLLRSASPIFDPSSREGSARMPLVGMPFPIDGKAGYEIGGQARYAFVRADVAEALRVAFRQTRRRFDRNRIAIGDASQWDGAKPASDIGQPRHISHVGGRDVDIGLPASDGPSSLQSRCEVVLVERDRAGCAPGTVSGLDAERLAYLLAQLVDGPTPGGRFVAEAKHRPGPIAPVEVIFTDQAYVDAVRQALPELRKKQWIHDEAFGALGEEGFLRASPWHVDHVHVRFRGDPATPPEALRFEAKNDVVLMPSLDRPASQ